MQQEIAKPPAGGGFILLVALAFLAGIMALITVGTSRSLTERLAVERFVAKQQAFYLAEAGVDIAIRQLTTNPDYVGPDEPYTPIDPNNLNRGGYTIMVKDKDDDPSLSDLQRRLDVTGHFPTNNAAATGYMAQQVRVVVMLPDPWPFVGALVSDTVITENAGASIDSYKSEEGPYSLLTARSHGDIVMSKDYCNDDFACPSLTLQGSEVNGDLILSEGVDATNPNDVVYNPVYLNGEIISDQPVRTLPGPQWPTSYDSWSLSGLTIHKDEHPHFPGGTYFADTLMIEAGGTLEFDGPARIIFGADGMLYAGQQPGQIENTTGWEPCFKTYENKPQNLIIESFSVEPMNLSDVGDFYGVVNTAYLTIASSASETGANLHGSFAASNLTVTRSCANGIPCGPPHIHYDESLKTAGIGSSNRITISVWRQLDPS